MIEYVLLDNSAWSRLSTSTLSDTQVEAIATAFELGVIHTCTPFLLEAGYSARSATDHADILTRLGSLPFAAIDADVESSAHRAQSELARAGHHRLPPIDVLIAAIAHRHGLGILHYDADYDTISERTSLKFESVWLAPRGLL